MGNAWRNSDGAETKRGSKKRAQDAKIKVSAMTIVGVAFDSEEEAIESDPHPYSPKNGSLARWLRSRGLVRGTSGGSLVERQIIVM